MGFTKGTWASISGSSSPLFFGFSASPTAGSLLVAVVAFDAPVSNLQIQDSSTPSNLFTITPNSPSSFQSGAGQVYLAYILTTPSNVPQVNWLVSWSGTANVTIWVDEFIVAGGVASFDTEASATSAIAGTSINTPSITPTGVNELLYAGCAAGGTVSSPTAGGTQGVWTGSGGSPTSRGMAEYVLSASAGTAVDFVQTSGVWSAIAAAFGFQVVYSTEPGMVDTGGDYWLGGDEY